MIALREDDMQVAERVDLSRHHDAFAKQREVLITEGGERWIVFSAQSEAKRFPDFATAFAFASDHYEEGEFIIRDLAAEESFLPLVCLTE